MKSRNFFPVYFFLFAFLSSPLAMSCTESNLASFDEDCRDIDGDSFGVGVGGLCDYAQDCNDADPSVQVLVEGFTDADGDGFGAGDEGQRCLSAVDAASFVNANALVIDNTDCNDDDATVQVGLSGYLDEDGDGFGTGTSPDLCVSSEFAEESASKVVTSNTDCDDSDASKFMSQEIYGDLDGDGYTGDQTLNSCVGDTPPNGYLLTRSEERDCDDADGGRFESQTIYPDFDEDGYTGTQTLTICQGAALPQFYQANASAKNDCNDLDASINPGAEEVAGNLTDDNCDGNQDIISNGAFVAKTGSDSNAGSKSAPFLTIQHAIENRGASNNIYVAKGDYNEGVTSYESIGLYGGFNNAFTKQDKTDYPTRIIGTSPAIQVMDGGVVAIGGMTLEQADATAGSTVINHGQLTIRHSTVRGADSTGCLGNSIGIENQGQLDTSFVEIFAGSVACGSSYGVYTSGGTTNLNNSLVVGNASIDENAYGIYQLAGAGLHVNNSTVILGQGTEIYGIYVTEVTGTINNSKVDANQQTNGRVAGIYGYSSKLSIADSEIDFGFDASGDEHVMGVYINNPDTTVTSLIERTSITNQGGACFAYGVSIEEANATLDDVDITLGSNNDWKLRPVASGVGDFLGDGSTGTFRRTSGGDFTDDMDDEHIFYILSGNQQHLQVARNEDSDYSHVSASDIELGENHDIENHPDGLNYPAETDVKFSVRREDCFSAGVYRRNQDDDFNLTISSSMIDAGKNGRVYGVMSRSGYCSASSHSQTNIMSSTVVGTGGHHYRGVSIQQGFARVNNNVIDMEMEQLQVNDKPSWGLYLNIERDLSLAYKDRQIWVNNNDITVAKGARQTAMNIDGVWVDRNPTEDDMNCRYGPPNYRNSERYSYDDAAMVAMNNTVKCTQPGGTPQGYGWCTGLMVHGTYSDLLTNDVTAGPVETTASVHLFGLKVERVAVNSRDNTYRTGDMAGSGPAYGIKGEYEINQCCSSGPTTDGTFYSQSDTVLVGKTGAAGWPSCIPDQDSDDGPNACRLPQVFGVKINEDVSFNFVDGTVDVDDSEGAWVTGMYWEYGPHFAITDSTITTGSAGSSGCYDDEKAGVGVITPCRNVALSFEGPNNNAGGIVDNTTLLTGVGQDTVGLKVQEMRESNNEFLTVTDSTIGAAPPWRDSYGIQQVDDKGTLYVDESLVWAGEATQGNAYGWWYDDSDSAGCNPTGLSAQFVNNTFAAAGTSNAFALYSDDCGGETDYVAFINNEIATAGTPLQIGASAYAVTQINACGFAECESASGNVESSSSAESLSPY